MVIKFFISIITKLQIFIILTSPLLIAAEENKILPIRRTQLWKSSVMFRPILHSNGSVPCAAFLGVHSRSTTFTINVRSTNLAGYHSSSSRKHTANSHSSMIRHRTEQQGANYLKQRYRLFGSKRQQDSTILSPPGKITIYNEQTNLPNIDIPIIEQTISTIRDIINYPTYDITLILSDDEYMREINLETRGMDKPTDILSFPFQDCLVEPGTLEEPDFDIPEYYNLGDMILDVPYVMRRCEEDYEDYENPGGDNNDRTDDYDDEEEEERGVSGAMARIYNPEERIPLLLVHGMLHLVGYDHIEDDDFELMVKREEEVVDKLRKRMESYNK